VAYTLEIVGAATYTFQVQPLFKPRFDYEYDEQRTPPPLVAEIETWLLEGAVYTGTDSAVTADLENLRAILGNRAAPITSARFKNGAATVREINTATHRGGLFVRSLDPTAQAGDGAWANHWAGDLVVYGRRLFADGDGIVKLQKELAYNYDSAGLATVTQRGSVTTIPGTSAEATARSQALASPGASYGLLTAGPNDEPNVARLDPDDTSASFESVWKQRGVSLPAGVNEYDLVVETVDGPDGEVVTTTVRAKGPTPSSLRTAVRAKKPTAALAGAQESEDKAGVEWTAAYVQRRPSATTHARTGSSKIVYRRLEYSIEGEDEGQDRDDTVDLVPGYLPHFTSNPRGAKTVTERIVARVRGSWKSLEDFSLGSKARNVGELRPQPGRTRGIPPVLEEQGLTRDADLWRAEAEYVFLARSVDPNQIAELAKGQ